MKRIASFIVTCIVLHAFANGQQTGSTTLSMNFEQFQKKVQKSDADIQDPKKSVNPKTWFSRGELMETIYELNGIRTSIQPTLNPVLIKGLFGEPKNTETQQLPNGSKKEVFQYDGFELVLINDKFSDWTQTRFVVDRPLEEAYQSYLKCKDLDTEGKMTKKLTEKFKMLNKEFQKEGVYQYTKATQSDEAKDDAGSNKHYNEAYQDFSRAVEVGKMPLVDKVDTVFMYYAGYCANKAKLNKEAIKYLEMARALNLDEPNMYQLLAESYIATGDTAKGIEAVKSGINTLKDNSTLVIYLVNFYLKSGNSNEALSYINLAEKLDSTNKTLYFVEGTLYDKLNNFEKAKEAYNKALSIDPTYFDAIFNFGVLYFNHAVKLMDDAMMEKDNKKYAEKKAIADNELKNALPYMEKSREISPNDKTTLETLKTLYYRLQMNDKFEEVQEKLKTIN